MSKETSDLEDFDAKEQAEEAAQTALVFRDTPDRAIHLATEATKKAERNKESLRKVISDLATLVRMVRAWFKKEYRLVPWRTIAIAMGAIIYFVNPFDAMPDFVPGVGYLDDALVIGVTANSLKSALEAFKLWEKNKK